MAARSIWSCRCLSGGSGAEADSAENRSKEDIGSEESGGLTQIFLGDSSGDREGK